MITIRKTNEGYQTISDDGIVLDSYKKVAFAFDKEDSYLYKWGNPENVNRWADGARHAYHKSGFHDMAKSLVVLESDELSQEECEKIVEITGYIGKLYEKLK